MGMIETKNQQRRDERKQAAEEAADKAKPPRDRTAKALAEIEDPDPQNIGELSRWLFAQVKHNLGQMNTKKQASARIRAITSMVDSIVKLKRLANESQELEDLKADLDALKAELLKESKIVRVK